MGKSKVTDTQKSLEELSPIYKDEIAQLALEGKQGEDIINSLEKMATDKLFKIIGAFEVNSNIRRLLVRFVVCGHWFYLEFDKRFGGWELSLVGNKKDKNTVKFLKDFTRIDRKFQQIVSEGLIKEAAK